MLQGNWKIWYFQNVPSMYQEFPKNGAKVIHCEWKCQYILTVPKRNQSAPLFQFILNFTGSVYCDHIIWQIAKNILDNLLWNTIKTFFGNFLNFPNNCLIGKWKSHGLVHCKSTEHVLHWGYCREIDSEYSECTYNMLARYIFSSLSQNSQCTKHVTAWYITLHPQCVPPGNPTRFYPLPLIAPLSVVHAQHSQAASRLVTPGSPAPLHTHHYLVFS